MFASISVGDKSVGFCKLLSPNRIPGGARETQDSTFEVFLKR